jgi:hypothetical protein
MAIIATEQKHQFKVDVTKETNIRSRQIGLGNFHNEATKLVELIFLYRRKLLSAKI